MCGVGTTNNWAADSERNGASLRIQVTSDVVSRKALAAGFTGENVTPICRWLAPFRSK